MQIFSKILRLLLCLFIYDDTTMQSREISSSMITRSQAIQQTNKLSCIFTIPNNGNIEISDQHLSKNVTIPISCIAPKNQYLAAQLQGGPEYANYFQKNYTTTIKTTFDNYVEAFLEIKLNYSSEQFKEPDSILKTVFIKYPLTLFVDLPDPSFMHAELQRIENNSRAGIFIILLYYRSPLTIRDFKNSPAMHFFDPLYVHTEEEIEDFKNPSKAPQGKNFDSEYGVPLNLKWSIARWQGGVSSLICDLLRQTTLNEIEIFGFSYPKNKKVFLPQSLMQCPNTIPPYFLGFADEQNLFVASIIGKSQQRTNINIIEETKDETLFYIPVGKILSETDTKIAPGIIEEDFFLESPANRFNAVYINDVSIARDPALTQLCLTLRLRFFPLLPYNKSKKILLKYPTNLTIKGASDFWEETSMHICNIEPAYNEFKVDIKFLFYKYEMPVLETEESIFSPELQKIFAPETTDIDDL